MIVPVWVAAWELDCCQPDAEVGSAWSVSLSFRPGIEPWWADEYGVVLSEEQRVLGRVDLDVALVAAGDNPVYRSGSIHFHAPAELLPGPHTGRISLDAHPTDGHSLTQVTCSGMETAISVVPIRYERRGAQFEPADQLDQIPASTTLARDGVRQSAVGDSLVTPELLVWADFGPC